MEILATVGIKVDYDDARDIFRQAGAAVDDAQQCVRIPETLVRWAVEQAPGQFSLYGFDPEFRLAIGGDRVTSPGSAPHRTSSTRRRASAGRPPTPMSCAISN